MKRLILAAALILGAAAGAAAEGKVKAKTPSQEVAALVSFTPPKGWTLDEYANADGADPVVRFENLVDVVQVRVFGAPRSDYPAPEDFLLGSDASEDGTVSVAGRKLALHRRRFAIVPRDPHHPSALKSPRGKEVFFILPLKDGRYAVIAYLRASPIPDLHRTGEKAWAAFLKTVRPKTK